MEPHVPLDLVTDDMLDRYLAGVATPAEGELVATALSANPGLEGKLKRISAFAENATGDSEWDTPALWADLVDRIDAESPVVAEVTPVSVSVPGREAVATRPRAIRWILGAMAMIALIAVGTQSIPRYFLNAGSAAVSTPSMRTVSTRLGQQAHFRFTDGSSVLLAPGTTLRYSSSFDKGDRTVELDGEALFTVTHDDKAPFVVRAGASSVRVLGTTFSVRRYNNDRDLRVVVAQGKVLVGQKILASGDGVSVNANGVALVERGVDIRSELAWTTGTLAFRKVLMRDVIPELRRWYGLDISVSDVALLDRDITATFLIDAPDNALKVLSILLRADVIRNGERVTFTTRE